MTNAEKDIVKDIVAAELAKLAKEDKPKENKPKAMNPMLVNDPPATLLMLAALYWHNTYMLGKVVVDCCNDKGNLTDEDRNTLRRFAENATFHRHFNEIGVQDYATLGTAVLRVLRLVVGKH